MTKRQLFAIIGGTLFIAFAAGCIIGLGGAIYLLDRALSPVTVVSEPYEIDGGGQ